MASPSRLELKPKDLRWTCEPNQLGFETTDDFSCKPHIIGQDRALDAIRLGLEMQSRGYNIYISGLTGTGRTTAIKRMLETMDLSTDSLTDLCYVHNFKAPDRPVSLILPAGLGVLFKERLKEVLKTLNEHVPAVLQSDQFRRRQSRIVEEAKKRKNKLTQVFEKEVTDRGFRLVEVEYGQITRPDIAPVVAGEAVTMDALPGLLVKGKLGKGDYQKMQNSYPKLVEQLEDILIATRDLQRELTERVTELENEHIQPMVAYSLGETKQEFDFEKIGQFLEGLEKYIMDNLLLFLDHASETDRDIDPRMYLPFEVNVIVDNTGAKEKPVVIETAPTYVNLFGTIERTVDTHGERTADFTAVRSGSLLQANGGYLILDLNDVLDEPQVYVTLKRALKNQCHQIRGFDALLSLPVVSLKPEPVDLDIKVVLMGDAYSYQVLYEYDEDFPKIFKVKAEFDSVMPRLRKNLTKYSHFIKTLCGAEKLLPYHKTGVAAVIEEGVRQAGRQNKLTTRFSDVGDLVREAHHWAKKDKARSVRREHVEKAAVERTRRASLYEEKMQEMFDDGTILIDTKGAKVGQINGLAVFDVGDHAFGKPSRITVETGVGRAGVINIEREAEMSGRTHNKGVLILEGYLRRMYAQDKPITMTASVCFEQAYSGVDGDSASSTEIYGLLSSLSRKPLRQDIAVTGSVNQKGEIQPIGGVNEKIEGFFDVCKHAGLTGAQGVMIPRINKKDLMLRKDVVKAVQDRKFHIYAIRSIDEGIELLTGKKAGRRRKNGTFEKGSVHDFVDAGLRHYQEQLRNAENGDDEKRENESP